MYPPLSALAALGLLGLSGGAAAAASATGHASVVLLEAITLAESAPMSFGQVGGTGAAGSVVLAPTGAINGPAGFRFAGAPAAARFTVAGERSSAVTISFSAGNSLTGPGPAMPLGGFTHNAGASPALDSTGSLTVAVGATLGVGAAQPPGSYSGSYTVTVNY